MALTEATVTFNLADLLGAAFDPRRTKVWLTTNSPDGSIHDESTGETRVGGGSITLAADGTGSATVWTPGVDANPATWQTTIHADYPDGASRQRKRVSWGPFTITASAALPDLVEEQVAVPTATAATYATQAGSSATAASSSATAAATSATAAQTARTGAETARTGAETARAGAEAAEDAAQALVLSDLGTTDGQTRALVENPLSQTAVALSNTIAPGQRPKGLLRADRHRDGAVSSFDGLAAHLAHGYGIASVGLASDSTGANPGTTRRWFWYLSKLIADAYPDVLIRFRDFDYTTTQRWEAPVVINAPSGVTRVRWNHPGTANQSPYLYVTPEQATADIDAAVEVALIDWTPASYGTLIGRCVPSVSTIDWIFGVNTDGTLRLRWYQNSGAFTTVSSTVAVTDPGAGVPLFLRVTLDADTGAGYEVKFWTSPDGATWTQLGTTVTSATAKEVRYSAGSARFIGSTNGGSGYLAGDYYEAWVRGYIDGPLIAPISPQNWGSYSAGVFKQNLLGGPQLDFWNGAWPGENIAATFDNPDRQPHMVADQNALLWLFNTSHNDGTLVGEKLLDAWDSMLDAYRAAVPGAALAAINQNPALTATTNMPSHPIRLNQLTAALRTRGVDVIDTYRMMLEDGRAWSGLIDVGDGDGQKHILDTGVFNPDADPDDPTPLNPQVAQALIVFNALMASPFSVRNPDELVRA